MSVEKDAVIFSSILEVASWTSFLVDSEISPLSPPSSSSRRPRGTVAASPCYLDLDEVLDAITNRPPMQHVIATGRGAHRSLVELADTVSEVQSIKHAFDNKIKAQKGIDW